MYYQKYNKKEIRKNISYVWNNITIKDYINQLTEISNKQQIAIENK